MLCRVCKSFYIACQIMTAQTLQKYNFITVQIPFRSLQFRVISPVVNNQHNEVINGGITKESIRITVTIRQTWLVQGIVHKHPTTTARSFASNWPAHEPLRKSMPSELCQPWILVKQHGLCRLARCRPHHQAKLMVILLISERTHSGSLWLYRPAGVSDKWVLRMTMHRILWFVWLTLACHHPAWYLISESFPLVNIQNLFELVMQSSNFAHFDIQLGNHSDHSRVTLQLKPRQT